MKIEIEFKLLLFFWEEVGYDIDYLDVEVKDLVFLIFFWVL